MLNSMKLLESPDQLNLKFSYILELHVDQKKWFNVKSEKLPRFTRWVDSKLKQVIILSTARGESKHETTS